MVPQLSRYAIVSVMALVADFSVFFGFNAIFGLPTLAGVIGYSCGIVLHYFLSRNFVFNAMHSRKSAHRLFSEFLASGLIGLTATAAVITLATTYLGVSAVGAKILAVGASFVGVFLIRRTIVFA